MSLRMIGAAIGHGAQDPESQNAPDVVRVSGLAKMIEEIVLRKRAGTQHYIRILQKDLEKTYQLLEIFPKDYKR